MGQLANPLGIKSIDHLEFCCPSLENSPVGPLFSRLGFKRIARAKGRELYTQGQIRFLLSDASGVDGHGAKYLEKHGQGVCTLSFLVEDVAKAHGEALARGAREVVPLQREGELAWAKIAGPGSIVGEFIQRHPGHRFLPGLEDFGEDRRASPLSARVGRIDHLTHNVPYGEMDKWAHYYERIFGFKETRYFKIEGEKTGLNSRVMQLENNAVIIPINQPKSPGGKDQIQEFLDVHRGIGVQHIALSGGSVVETVDELQKRDIPFLSVPHTYYEDIPAREKACGFRLEGPVDILEKRGLLVDGDKEGYLLQIFTKNMVGPLFFEFIQRKNHWGFGEGNFKALFDAIERDQMQRGYLT